MTVGYYKERKKRIKGGGCLFKMINVKHTLFIVISNLNITNLEVFSVHKSFPMPVSD